LILDTGDQEIKNSHYCLSVLLQGELAAHRNTIVMKLKQAGIGSSVYYPHPVPRMTYYKKKYGFEERLYPNATAISDCSIALPVGPHVTSSDVEFIVEHFKQALKEVHL
jgi:dTDP-4-amino-4,6-dideoxygalactose transaminase